MKTVILSKSCSHCGSTQSKNRSGEQPRTATARKNDKNRFRRRLRTHFFVPGPVFGQFCAPGCVPKWHQKAPWKKVCLLLDHIFSISLCFVRSGVFRQGHGAILEAPGTLPDQILRGFCDTFCRLCGDLIRVCRVPPGSIFDVNFGTLCFMSSSAA